MSWLQHATDRTPIRIWINSILGLDMNCDPCHASLYGIIISHCGRRVAWISMQDSNDSTRLHSPRQRNWRGSAWTFPGGQTNWCPPGRTPIAPHFSPRPGREPARSPRTRSSRPSRHPRIGEPPGGDDAEAHLARSEQSNVDSSDSAAQKRLTDGNRAYEDKFGRVFLVRAAGRSTSDILTALDRRLLNDEASELAVVAEELRDIAARRLAGMLDA